MPETPSVTPSSASSYDGGSAMRPGDTRVTADLTPLPGTAPLCEVIAVIERDGGAIVEDFVPAAVIAELKADLLPKIEACAPGRDDFSGFRTRRMSALFAKSPHVADVAIHPLFLGAAEH